MAFPASWQGNSSPRSACSMLSSGSPIRGRLLTCSPGCSSSARSFWWDQACYLLRTHGQPSEEGAEPTNFAWENTSQLIDIGIYRHLRHPMYASLLVLTWGVFLKDVSLAGLLLSVAASTCLLATARVEEQEDLVRFGAAYSSYCRRTRRFIPFVY